MMLGQMMLAADNFLRESSAETDRSFQNTSVPAGRKPWNARVLHTFLSDEFLQQRDLTVLRSGKHSHLIQLPANSDFVIANHTGENRAAADTGSPSISPPVWLSSFNARIADLREAADEDSEPFNEASVAAATTFAESLHDASRPGIFLVGNGNIRLKWENSLGEQVAFQFVDDRIQFVLMIGRSGKLAEHYGFDEISHVWELVHQLGLQHVLKR